MAKQRGGTHIQIKVGKINIGELRDPKKISLTSSTVKADVEAAPMLQTERFKKISAGKRATTNSEMSSRQVETLVALDPAAEHLLTTLDLSTLSPRGYYRLLKVGRTIADLEGKEYVSAQHLAEAFSYRLKDER